MQKEVCVRINVTRNVPTVSAVGTITVNKAPVSLRLRPRPAQRFPSAPAVPRGTGHSRRHRTCCTPPARSGTGRRCWACGQGNLRVRNTLSACQPRPAHRDGASPAPGEQPERRIHRRGHDPLVYAGEEQAYQGDAADGEERVVPQRREEGHLRREQRRDVRPPPLHPAHPPVACYT